MPQYRIASHERTYTRDELAAALGVPLRTLRYWRTELKLIDPPSPRTSRYARYTDRHLAQGRAVLALRDRTVFIGDVGDILRDEGISVDQFVARLDAGHA